RNGVELEPLEFAITLEGLPRVVGTLDCMFPGGRVEHTFSKPSARRLLALWIRHLALAASGRVARSTLIAREDDKPSVQVLGTLAPETARRHLSELVALFVEGQSRPLPFLATVSHCYLLGIRRGSKTKGPKSPAEALNSAVYEYDGKESERDPHAPLAFDRLLPPFDAEYDAERRPLEATPFHTLAARVYDPLLAALVEGNP
ncbi:MAG TPA: hypothetical protein VLJ38_18825, partial [Polyangiaceae bacterium]|nr:hypothetical protein [Polyangiaceae bacterium]